MDVAPSIIEYGGKTLYHLVYVIYVQEFLRACLHGTLAKTAQLFAIAFAGRLRDAPSIIERVGHGSIAAVRIRDLPSFGKEKKGKTRRHWDDSNTHFWLATPVFSR